MQKAQAERLGIPWPLQAPRNAGKPSRQKLSHRSQIAVKPQSGNRLEDKLHSNRSWVAVTAGHNQAAVTVKVFDNMHTRRSQPSPCPTDKLRASRKQVASCHSHAAQLTMNDCPSQLV